MSAETRGATSTGVSSFTLLGLLFVGLKLGHVIDWSWWWVTVPFWGGYVLIALFLVLVMIVAALVSR